MMRRGQLVEVNAAPKRNETSYLRVTISIMRPDFRLTPGHSLMPRRVVMFSCPTIHHRLGVATVTARTGCQNSIHHGINRFLEV